MLEYLTSLRAAAPATYESANLLIVNPLFFYNIEYENEKWPQLPIYCVATHALWFLALSRSVPNVQVSST